MIIRNLPTSVETEIEFDSYLWILQILKLFSLIIGKRFFYQVNYKYIRGKRLELNLVDLINQSKVIFRGIHFSMQFDSLNNPKKLDDELEFFAKKWRKETLSSLISFQEDTIKTSSTFRFRLLNLSDFLYSPISQKHIFEPIAFDWQKEHFEALFKQEIWKARWINVSYTYAFIVAMWMKSPIGDLIEFVRKLAK